MRIHFKTDYLQDIRLFEDRRDMIQYHPPDPRWPCHRAVLAG